MSAVMKPETVQADQVYNAEQVAALLGVSRATFYTIAWFKNKRVRLSAQRVGYLASDVRLYQSLMRGR